MTSLGKFDGMLLHGWLIGEPLLTKGNGNWKIMSCIAKMVIDYSWIMTMTSRTDGYIYFLTIRTFADSPHTKKMSSPTSPLFGSNICKS